MTATFQKAGVGATYADTMTFASFQMMPRSGSAHTLIGSSISSVSLDGISLRSRGRRGHILDHHVADSHSTRAHAHRPVLFQCRHLIMQPNALLGLAGVDEEKGFIEEKSSLI